MASQNEPAEAVAKRIFIITMVGASIFTAACFIVGW